MNVKELCITFDFKFDISQFCTNLIVPCVFGTFIKIQSVVDSLVWPTKQTYSKSYSL